MRLLSLVVAAIGFSTAATAYAAAGPCKSDEDCSLNGVCQSSSCVCDTPWVGDDCSLLEFAPAPQHVSFHGESPETTSWGGSVLPFAAKNGDTNYVMFAAEMDLNCSLSSWQSNSKVVVATSPLPEGPYTEILEAIPPWAHNPEAIHISGAAGSGSDVWCIFSLGDGVPIRPLKNCTGPSLPIVSSTSKAVRAPSPGANGGNTTVSFAIHYSTSGPLGPWQVHKAVITDFPTEYSFPGNWNPAPELLPDGRVRIMVHTDTSPWAGEVIVEAASWRGPYHPITKDITRCTKCQEDPFMWTDKRGNWHVLYHRMFDPPGKGPIPSPGWVGGHSFSRDGLIWSPITRCYNTSVSFTDGTVVELERRERPKLIFAADGFTPIALSNGVVGPEGTYTLVVPLASPGVEESKSSAIGPSRTIAPGVVMPRVSLGHPDPMNSSVVNETVALETWLSVGGLGIDTAYDYGNQVQVGEAIRRSGKNRSQLFVTTKVPGCIGSEKALAMIQSDLQQMQLDYVDLVLIHFPYVHRYPPIPATTAEIQDTWRGFEKALNMKLTRSIGVSNFNETQLSAILELGLTAPAINQCEMSVGYHDDATIKFCKKNGITYEAYSPLGRGGAYPGCDPSDQRITRIAKAHNRSIYQVCLRWIVQQDMCLAVSSTKASHDTSDLMLFDFELTPAEMATLASI